MIANLYSFFLMPLLLMTSSVTCDDDVTLRSVMAAVQQQAATIQQLQAQVSSLEAGQQQHSGSINDLQTKVTSVNVRLGKRVYFTAHISQNPVNVGTDNSPFKFDNVVTNFGGGYNPQTGAFTAPEPGDYVFYAQIMAHGNPIPNIHYAIEKTRGTLLCVNSSGDGNIYDKSTCLATVHLNRGETVIVRRTDGVTEIEGYWCFFSGFLLSPDA